MLRSVLSLASTVLLVTSMLTITLNAGTPLIIPYQGRLLDAADVPISGSYSITYSIFDVPTGGSLLWSESHIGINVADGLFSVQLGSVVPLTADILTGTGSSGVSIARYLEIQLSGQPAISPRTQLASSPYAVASSRIDGDVTSSPGMLTIGDGLTSMDIVAKTSSTDASISISESGIKRFGVGVEQPDYPSGVKVAIGDLDGDGFEDLILASTPDSVGIRIDQQGHTSYALSTKGSSHSNMHLRTYSPGTPLFGGFSVETTDSGSVIQSSLFDFDGESYFSAGGKNIRKTISVGLFKKNHSAELSVDNARSAFSLQNDSDENGIAEQSIESDCDDSTATFGILAGVAIPKFIDLTARAEGSSIKQGSIGGGQSIESDCDDSTSVLAILAGVAIPKFIDITARAEGSSIKQGSIGGGQSIESDCDDSTSVLAILAGVAIPKFIDITARAEGSTIRQGSLGGSASIESDCDDTTATFGILAGVAVPKFINLTVEAKGSSMRVGSGSGNLGVTSSSDDSTATLGILAGVAIPRFINVTSEAHRSSLSIGSTVTKGRLECDDIDTRLALTPSGSGSYGFELRCGESSGSLPPSSSACFTSDTGDTTFIIHGDGRLGLGVGDPSHFVDVQGGAYCDGTNWVNASDANSKENFESVDGGEILEKISDLDITKWNYKGDDVAKHIGPTAQDFKRAFGVGADDKSISTVDPSGIALAAIKELSKQNRELKAQNAKLMKQMDDLAKKVEKLAFGK